MKAKEYLERLKLINYMIVNKSAEVDMWKSKAEGSGGFSDGERVQSSGDKQKMASAVISYADLEAEIEELKAEKKDIVDNLEKLRAEHYDFLHKHYIQDISIKGIARMKGRSESWASTTHDRAKRELQRILDGENGKI